MLEEQKEAAQSRAIDEQQVQKELEAPLLLIAPCGRARQELSTLKKGRAFRYNSNEERIFLDDDAVKFEIKRLTEFIEVQCNSSPGDVKEQILEAEKFKKQQSIEDNCIYMRQRYMIESPRLH